MVSVFFIIAIIVYGIGIYISIKHKFWKFQLALIAGLMAIWYFLKWWKGYLSERVIFEEVGLVKALVMQIMDNLFFNFVAPVTSFLVAMLKRIKTK